MVFDPFLELPGHPFFTILPRGPAVDLPIFFMIQNQNQSGQLFFFHPRTFIQYSLWQGEREREVHICHIWTKQGYWKREKANESQILTMDILSSPKTDLSDSHKKERIWREVELKKNEQHCSGLHFLAQLAQPPSGNLATASCLTFETNAFIFLHASTLPSF